MSFALSGWETKSGLVLADLSMKTVGSGSPNADFEREFRFPRLSNCNSKARSNTEQFQQRSEELFLVDGKTSFCVEEERR